MIQEKENRIRCVADEVDRLREDRNKIKAEAGALRQEIATLEADHSQILSQP